LNEVAYPKFSEGYREVATQGKRLLRGVTALHLVSAYATEVGVMLAQQRRGEIK
jgi:hypothetical protein